MPGSTHRLSCKTPPGLSATPGIGTLRGPGTGSRPCGATAVPVQRAEAAEFRASFYNLFNHANLNNPDTDTAQHHDLRQDHFRKRAAGH